MKEYVFSFTSSEALGRKAGYSGSWKQSRRRTSPEANAIMVPFWLAVQGEGIIQLPGTAGKGYSPKSVQHWVKPGTDFLVSEFVQE